MKKIKLIKVRVNLTHPNTFPKGFVNKEALDATTDFEIEKHKKEDDDQARLDALNKNA
jgi:putative transcriptional regulator